MKIRRSLPSLAIVALALLPAGARAIDDVPLFLSVSIPPNVVMTLDDSGSMAFAFIPESLNDRESVVWSPRYTASRYNALYYDPDIDYPIPTRQDGKTYTTSFTSARFNGFDASRGTVDLSTGYAPLLYQLNGNTVGSCRSGSINWSATCKFAQRYSEGQAAFYHRFKASCSSSQLEQDACYEKILVGSAADSSRRRAEGNRQNFANWYSFYKTRALAAASGAMRALERIDNGSIRFGWQALNRCTSFGTDCEGYNGNDSINRLMVFDAAHRTRFYDWLERMNVSGGTPLRSALVRAGNYFKLRGKNSPYAEDPYVRQGTEYACRKNFHLMFTDGVWNGDKLSVGNVDSASYNLPDGERYTQRTPFMDSNSSSLADLAFDFWRQDLREDLADQIVPRYVDTSDANNSYWNPRNSVSSWQNMINYAVGFGLGRSLNRNLALGGNDWQGSTYKGAYTVIAAGKASWPSTSNEDEGRVYDLWHAAINSRGEFFSADDPETLAQAFADAFASIQAANPSAAALSANSTSLNTGSLIYQARFDSANWRGQLQAREPRRDGSVGVALWDAAERMPAHGSRNIYSYRPDTRKGFAFTACSAFSGEQKAILGANASGSLDNALCEDRLKWLRGDDGKEQRKGGSFRNRADTAAAPVRVLGDIVNADPFFSHGEDFGYAGRSGMSDAERRAYPGFVSSKRARLPVVYAGANDGMLHAFRADRSSEGGRELFAFVPNAVYPQLASLPDPAYSHRYSVDGAPLVADAYLGTWKSVLVGGLGKGGRSVYALDVTDPAAFGAQHVMWEFSHPDLGFTFSQPQIARLANGEWVAIFGNGYASAQGQASLFVVRLSDGALIANIKTDIKSGNGLSTPRVADDNGDGVADRVYAGDLAGRLWVFELGVDSLRLGNGGAPLFDAGSSRPITAQPARLAHPQGGAMLLFGTGRYLASPDIQDTGRQAFYGVWDKPGLSGTVIQSDLVRQSIVREVSAHNYALRETSRTQPDWTRQRGWMLELAVSGQPDKGERVVYPAQVIGKLAAFTTLTPSRDPCVPGGSSWFMELDALTGAAHAKSPFDLNQDGVFDEKDLLPGGGVASGVQLGLGISKPPVLLTDTALRLKFFTGTSGETLMLGNEGPPRTGAQRVYWRQII